MIRYHLGMGSLVAHAAARFNVMARVRSRRPTTLAPPAASAVGPCCATGPVRFQHLTPWARVAGNAAEWCPATALVRFRRLKRWAPVAGGAEVPCCATALARSLTLRIWAAFAVTFALTVVIPNINTATDVISWSFAARGFEPAFRCKLGTARFSCAPPAAQAARHGSSDDHSGKSGRPRLRLDKTIDWARLHLSAC